MILDAVRLYHDVSILSLVAVDVPGMECLMHAAVTEINSSYRDVNYFIVTSVYYRSVVEPTRARFQTAKGGED